MPIPLKINNTSIGDNKNILYHKSSKLVILTLSIVINIKEGMKRKDSPSRVS